MEGDGDYKEGLVGGRGGARRGLAAPRSRARPEQAADVGQSVATRQGQSRMRLQSTIRENFRAAFDFS